MNGLGARALSSVLAGLLLGACAPEPAPKTPRRPIEMVPIEPDAGVAPQPAASSSGREPGPEPLIAPPGDGGAMPIRILPTDEAHEAEPGMGVAPAGKHGPTASRAECEKSIDHYLKLLVGQDPRFKGVSAELLKSARAQASGQLGDPCLSEPPSTEQVRCALASKSKEAWERCMK
jgi:hypothetical protein